MAYYDNFSAASKQGDKVETRYMYAPGIGVTMTATPRNNWDTEKAGNMAEVAEYGKEIAGMLFQQLTPENQREILAMCMALASGDVDAAESGGAAHV